MFRVVLAETLYRPPIAVALIVLVLVIVLASGVLTANREKRWWPVLFRVIGVLALGWVLLGYSQTQQNPSLTDALPKLSILVDTSSSMAEEDAFVTPGAAPTTRTDAVSQAYLNDATLDLLRSVAEVELSVFDETIRPASSGKFSAEGEATAMYRAVAQTRSDVTLILSDGHDTTRQQPTGNFVSAGRLFAVQVGTPRSAPDLALQAWPDSDRLFEDQSTAITATLQQSGFDGRQAFVELLLEDEVVETQSVTLDERYQSVRFEVKPPLETGRTVQANLYEARVRLAEGEEAYRDNNAEHVAIQTTRGQIKVLLIEGEPYWDSRSLARLINGHPRFDLTALYGFGFERRAQLLGETIDRDIDPLDQIEAFDIIILGRQVQRLVDRNFTLGLSEYVRGGGAVLFARGRPYEIEAGEIGQDGFAFARGIEPITPVDWAKPVLGEMRVRIGQSTDPRGPLAGLQEGEVLTRLPGMIAATQISGRKTASLVMLEQTTDIGPAMAAMTSLRVGDGITMAVLTEGLWRWELLPGVDETDSEIETVYGSLWVRALQWLANSGEFLPGQDIALQADRVTADLNQPINLSISTRYVESEGLNLELTATHSDGTTQRLPTSASDTSGNYAAAFEPKQTGTYTIQLATPGRDDLVEPNQPMTARVVVIDRSPERRDTSARPEALKQLVEPTGGECLDFGEIEPLFEYLQTLQALRGSEDTVDYAFNTWSVFALIAGCFGLEWIFRRRMGLR